MAKRFINPDWKKLRGLTPNIQRAFFYCWDKADACGVYEYDPVYLKADLGIAISFEDLKKMPNATALPGNRIFFTDFIEINYGALKENYNPHKPAFRALDKNQISSLNQACPKLEEEEEDEDEEEGKDEEEKKEKVKKEKVELVYPFNSEYFLTVWDVLVKEPKWRNKSPAALQASLKFLSKWKESEAVQIMENSIAGGWQGLFELKNEKNGNSKTESSTLRERVAQKFNDRITGS